MKISRYPILPLLLVALLAAVWVGSPVLAQEDAEPDDLEEGPGKGFVELSGWFAQPTGLGYSPATRLDPLNPFGTRELQHRVQTNDKLRYRVGYELPGQRGKLMVTYFSIATPAELTASRPGEFLFGESLVSPLGAGVYNNGLADRFESASKTKLRDYRIDYSRTAFRSPRVTGEWFVGFRRTWHSRRLDASYKAVDPGFPAFFPPRPDLLPGVDSAYITSEFEGRGIEGGMDFEVPLLRNRLRLEAGFVYAILRGDLDTRYQSTTHFYLLDGFSILPPYSEFTAFEIDPATNQPVPVVTRVSQESFEIGLRTEGRSNRSDVLEAHVDLRFKAWKELDVFLGFRQASYSDVGLDLRPVQVTSLGGVNLQDARETSRSATYEGFYFGASYSF